LLRSVSAILFWRGPIITESVIGTNVLEDCGIDEAKAAIRIGAPAMTRNIHDKSRRILIEHVVYFCRSEDLDQQQDPSRGGDEDRYGASSGFRRSEAALF
jgi:hypothetical protein